MRICPNCGDEVIGRQGKKFCSPYCKSNYHYERSKEKESTLFKTIDKQLKLNRRILKNYNRSGKATVRAEELFKYGFEPKFFTHYWRNSKKQVYFFCYEFGFISFTDETGNRKFTLVKWQDYMDN
jgi:predicted nucleic acid-binding Zn ribbon protein